MDKEKLPIKFFAPREVDELLVEGGGNKDKPKWVLTGDKLERRATKLASSLDKIEKKLSERKINNSPVPFTFIAKIQEDSTAKSKRSSVTGMLQVGVDGVIGVASNNKLMVCIDSLEHLKEIGQRINQYEDNDYAISCIEDFEEFLPSVSYLDNKCNYKVKLIDYQNYEQNLSLQRLLERTFVKKKIEFKKTEYSENCYIYNIKQISKTQLDELENSEIFDAIFSVEPMPRYIAILDILEDDDTIPVKKPIHHHILAK